MACNGKGESRCEAKSRRCDPVKDLVKLKEGQGLGESVQYGSDEMSLDHQQDKKPAKEIEKSVPRVRAHAGFVKVLMAMTVTMSSMLAPRERSNAG
jgi:hypothetical protein